MRPQQADGDHAWRIGAIVPGVAGAVLHHAIACFQEHLRAVIQLEPYLAGHDDVVIDGIGGVHAGLIGLHDLSQAGEFSLHLRECRGHVQVLGPSDSVGRKREKAKAIALSLRKVAGKRGRLTVCGKRRLGIASPHAMKLESRKQGQVRTLHLLVRDKDRFPGCGLPCNDTADLHAFILSTKTIYSILTTRSLTRGNLSNTAGSCPGIISPGLAAICFMRSWARRFESASKVCAMGTCFSRFS